MRTLLDDLERALTDLLQMGLATTDPGTAASFLRLSERCAGVGLTQGGMLFAHLAQLLEQRCHELQKHDEDLTAAVCRAEHYITLCRKRLTEDDIRNRWQEGGTA